jgi:hypothetical protein
MSKMVLFIDFYSHDRNGNFYSSKGRWNTALDSFSHLIQRAVFLGSSLCRWQLDELMYLSSPVLWHSLVEAGHAYLKHGHSFRDRLSPVEVELLAKMCIFNEDDEWRGCGDFFPRQDPARWPRDMEEMDYFDNLLNNPLKSFRPDVRYNIPVGPRICPSELK